MEDVITNQYSQWPRGFDALCEGLRKTCVLMTSNSVPVEPAPRTYGRIAEGAALRNHGLGLAA